MTAALEKWRQAATLAMDGGQYAVTESGLYGISRSAPILFCSCLFCLKDGADSQSKQLVLRI